MRAYSSDAGDSHLLIEKFVKIHKCHCNILDQEPAYLEKLLNTIEEHADEVKLEKLSLREEKLEEKIDKEKATNQADCKVNEETASPAPATTAITE